MSTKHTPGPWMSPENKRDCTVWATKEGRTEQIVEATINPWCQPAEAHANSKLIAAAPELLDAIIDILDNVFIDFPDDDSRKLKLQELVDKATKQQP